MYHGEIISCFFSLKTHTLAFPFLIAQIGRGQHCWLFWGVGGGEVVLRKTEHWGYGMSEKILKTNKVSFFPLVKIFLLFLWNAICNIHVYIFIEISIMSLTLEIKVKWLKWNNPSIVNVYLKPFHQRKGRNISLLYYSLHSFAQLFNKTLTVNIVQQ